MNTTTPAQREAAHDAETRDAAVEEIEALEDERMRLDNGERDRHDDQAAPPITDFVWPVDAPAAEAAPLTRVVYIAMSHGPEGAFPVLASISHAAAIDAAVTEAMTNAGADGQQVQAALFQGESWTSEDGEFTVGVTGLPLT